MGNKKLDPDRPRERKPRQGPKVTILRKEYEVLLKKQQILDTFEANGLADHHPNYDEIMEGCS